MLCVEFADTVHEFSLELRQLLMQIPYLLTQLDNPPRHTPMLPQFVGVDCSLSGYSGSRFRALGSAGNPETGMLDLRCPHRGFAWWVRMVGSHRGFAWWGREWKGAF